ncbi:MAG: hypothetical protein HY791_12230 [Deltaproteobacteria bacterium]|nr:hypothetical protein [Deltaproteobacteria bacterium]
MSSQAHIVVTCTNRKTRPAPSDLSVRNLDVVGKSDRPRAWIARLRDSKEPSVPARVLYAGDHWSIARSLDRKARACGIEATTWVVSAGYGLVPISAELRPYAATFALGHEDSVVSGSSAPSSIVGLKEWWRSLAAWEGPTPTEARSLAELARRNPSTPIFIAAAPTYLAPLEDDLNEAAANLSSPELLFVASAGADDSGGFSRYLIPADAGLKHVLKGAMPSLNVRVLQEALGAWGACEFDPPALRRHFDQLRKEQPVTKKLDRAPMSDDEVRAFVRAELSTNPKSKHSPLLRKLRDSGRACEQKRFGTLFAEVWKEVVRD